MDKLCKKCGHSLERHRVITPGDNIIECTASYGGAMDWCTCQYPISFTSRLLSWFKND